MGTKPTTDSNAVSAQLTVKVTLHLERYVGSPYTKALFDVINIKKESGMSRARSESTKAKALEEHLHKIGLTYADYLQMEKAATAQWHTDEDGQIIVPGDRVLSMLVQASATFNSASRPCAPNNVKAYIKSSDFKTGKYEADGVWERFAVVTLGTGAKVSNQRAARSDEYIKDCDITGAVTFFPQFVSPDRLKTAFELAGMSVGIGASRSQGWGRFTLVGWEAE